MDTKARTHPRAILLALLIALSLPLTAISAKAGEKEEIAEALAWFRGCGEEVAARIDYFGRTPVDADERRYVMANLPKGVNDHVDIDPAVNARLARIIAPLKPFMPWLPTIQLLVFDSKMPWAGLYGRSVLAVSTGALDLLDDSEMRAICAHEYAHWLWPLEYKCALDKGDSRAVRLIELKCDALGLFYFRRAGGSLRIFLSATRKMNDHPLVPKDGDNHPSLDGRINFAQEVAKILSIPA